MRPLSHHFIFALVRNSFTFALSATLSIPILLESALIPDFTAFAINQNKIRTTIATHNLGRKSVAIEIKSPVNHDLRFTTSLIALFTTSLAMRI